MKQKKHTQLLAVLVSALCFLCYSCGDDGHYIQKPRGYFRIDLPQKSYKTLDTIERYSFEYPEYAIISHDKHAPDEPNWINVDYPSFRGTLHLSHKTINNNLGTYLEDVYTMRNKHLMKANGIYDSLIINPDRSVYGMTTMIEGKGVASPFQFYLTDSTDNFLRGALYFNFLPNNDSMQPVIDFIIDDINHLINTIYWK